MLGLGVAAVAGPGLSASAVVVPEPDPAASVSFGCDSGVGGFVEVTMTNLLGTTEAAFTITVNALTVGPLSTPSGGQTNRVFDALDEGLTYTVTVESAGMAPVAQTHTVDCYSATGEVALLCADDGPTIVATATNTGEIAVLAQLNLPGIEGSPFTQSVAPGSTYQFEQPVAEDASYTAILRADPEIALLDSSSGVANCAETSGTGVATTTASPGAGLPTTTNSPSSTVPASQGSPRWSSGGVLPPTR